MMINRETTDRAVQGIGDMMFREKIPVMPEGFSALLIMLIMVSKQQKISREHLLNLVRGAFDRSEMVEHDKKSAS